MLWTVTTPPAATPIVYADCKAQLRIDGDEEQYWFNTFAIPAVVDFAETACSRSFVTRQMQATYFLDDLPEDMGASHRFPFAYTGPFWGRMVALPRGPVQAVQAVSDQNGNAVATTGYKLERIGTQDYLRMSPLVWPPVISYTAGYGDATAVPAKIKLGMLMHVAHLWDNRSATTSKPMNYVLAGLDAIYGQAMSEVTL